VLNDLDKTLHDDYIRVNVFSPDSPLYQAPSSLMSWPLFSIGFPFRHVKRLTYHINIPSVGDPPYVYPNYDSKQQSWGAGQGQCVVKLDFAVNHVNLPTNGVTEPVPSHLFTNPPTTPAPTQPAPDVFPRVWVGIGVGVTVAVTLVCIICLFGADEQVATGSKISDF
jgi:hypothetical protein